MDFDYYYSFILCFHPTFVSYVCLCGALRYTCPNVKCIVSDPWLNHFGGTCTGRVGVSLKWKCISGVKPVLSNSFVIIETFELASHYCPKIAPLIHVFNRRIGWVYIQGFLGIRLVATDSLQGGRTVGKGDVRRQLNACRDREAGVCISGLGFWVVWAALVSQFGIRLEPGQISRLQFSSSNCRLL
ncbi:hypothetical protein V6N12_025288 [Hibiscus sabdariffa]|uniref:Uncharacterized protein n=1 Tax=Hibiscus sabdariffa TaxID=183260 RepID=A0ABR2BLZ1_9ROSI